jgi:hypothetical protein
MIWSALTCQRFVRPRLVAAMTCCAGSMEKAATGRRTPNFLELRYNPREVKQTNVRRN